MLTGGIIPWLELELPLSTPEGTMSDGYASFWLLISSSGEEKTPEPLELKKPWNVRTPMYCIKVILFGGKVNRCRDQFT